MKTDIKPLSLKRNRRSGFTLIEMIGVLAVIAILAAMLIPKVFEAINNARINNAAGACNTMKAGLADHYAKYSSIPVDGSTTPPTQLAPGAGLALQFDQVLMKEGLIEKPFLVKIGDGIYGPAATRMQIVAAAATGTSPGGANSAYDLDNAPPVNDAVGSVVAEAVITGVLENDAKDLNDRLDGTTLGVALGSGPDFFGRVKYDAPTGTPSTTVVHVYLTHR